MLQCKSDIAILVCGSLKIKLTVPLTISGIAILVCGSLKIKLTVPLTISGIAILVCGSLEITLTVPLTISVQTDQKEYGQKWANRGGCPEWVG